MRLDVETDVILAAQRGDPRAKAQLMAAARPFVQCVTLHFAKRNATDPDDCEQDGYLGLLRALELWRPARGLFGPWARMWVSAYSRRTGLVRRGSASVRRDREEVALDECVCSDGSTTLTWEECLAAGGESPEEVAARRERESRAAAGLGRLQPRHQEILQARAAGESLAHVGRRYSRTAEWARLQERAALEALHARAPEMRAEA